MTLTPEDVHKKTFTPVRLREGYDMGEVDQFLDEVEVELTRLHAENDELRGESGEPASTPSVSTPTAESTATAPAPVKVTTIGEASGAAARLLEIAAQNADQLVAEAHGDADKIVGEATVKAERLESESKATAERLEAEAQAAVEQQAAELAQRRDDLLGALEQDKSSLSGELEELRSFEREYRSRLRAYFESQLRTLDGEGDGAVPLSPADGVQAGDGSVSAGSPEGATASSDDTDQPTGRLSQLLGEDPTD